MAVLICVKPIIFIGLALRWLRWLLCFYVGLRWLGGGYACAGGVALAVVVALAGVAGLLAKPFSRQNYEIFLNAASGCRKYGNTFLKRWHLKLERRDG